MVNEKSVELSDNSTVIKQESQLEEGNDFLKLHNKRNEYLNIEVKPDDWVIEAKGSVE